jgi:hypothetical protein
MKKMFASLFIIIFSTAISSQLTAADSPQSLQEPTAADSAIANKQPMKESKQKQSNEAAPEKAPVDVGIIPEPPAGKGQVVFFRPKNFYAALKGCNVFESGAPVVKLGNGKYFVKTFDPGVYQFNSTPEAYGTDEVGRGIITAEIKPGSTSYIKCYLDMGYSSAITYIVPAYKANFEQHANKLQLMK